MKKFVAVKLEVFNWIAPVRQNSLFRETPGFEAWVEAITEIGKAYPDVDLDRHSTCEYVASLVVKGEDIEQFRTIFTLVFQPCNPER